MTLYQLKADQNPTGLPHKIAAQGVFDQNQNTQTPLLAFEVVTGNAALRPNEVIVMTEQTLETRYIKLD